MVEGEPIHADGPRLTFDNIAETSEFWIVVLTDGVGFEEGKDFVVVLRGS